MATKETKGTTSGKTADAAQGDVSQTAAIAPAAALPPATLTASGEQTVDQATPAAPAVLGPADTSGSNELGDRLDRLRTPIGISDVSAALQDGAKETPELPGYLVTDVSSVLHDGTWYHQDDEIFLHDKDAAPLLRRRIIEPSRSDK